MGRIFMVMLLGAGLFLGILYSLGMLDQPIYSPPDTTTAVKKVTVPINELGGDLYQALAFPAIRIAESDVADPIVLIGVMNAIEQEEVPSQVPGRILFIGDQVEDSAVLAAGSAAFIAEPYYFATIYSGEDTFVKFYRRLYEGKPITQGQMVAMVEPTKAMGEVLKQIAKIDLAKAELDAAIAGENEGYERYKTALTTSRTGSTSKEELGGARLTWLKLKGEKLAKMEGVKLARNDKNQADIDLQLHEIRPVMPYKLSFIKTIVRQRGYAVKQLDPVIVVQNLERLQAEALIEGQYFTRINDRANGKDKRAITATIEPTIQEPPLHVFLGHALDVTSVAVSRDLKIVSGSEDRTLCLWKVGSLAPLKKLDHDDAVRVVACAPLTADKNICLAGCANGSIYLWDLDAKDDEPLKLIPRDKAHGSDASITSLAFSPDGKSFASGASDGSIRMWSADGSERYAFVPENGVAQSHEDAVTSLHFTPQGRLISAGRDKTLRVWLLKEKGAAPDRKAIPFREGNVPQLGVSSDGKWMLFDRGRTLQLLSVEDQTLKFTVSLPVNATPFDTLAMFSPDSKLMLTAGAPEGKLQLWRTPDADSRAFEVRQFATRERLPVNCAAFSPNVGQGDEKSFAVSGSGTSIYVWSIPTMQEVNNHRITDVQMTLKTHSLDPSTGQSRIGFEVPNPPTADHPNGRFEAGRNVTIVIE